MLVHGLINVVVSRVGCAILKVVGSEMRCGGGKGTSREVLLMSEAVLGVRLVCVMVRGLRSVMVRVTLCLELWHLHGKSLVGLTAIHHHMLALVILTVHGERIQ